MKKLLLTSALAVLSLSEVFAAPPTYYVQWVSTPDINKGTMDWCHSDQAGNCLSKGNSGRLQLHSTGGSNRLHLTFQQPQKTITFEYKGNGPTTLCKGTYTFQEDLGSSGKTWDVKVNGINEKDQCNVAISEMK